MMNPDMPITNCDHHIRTACGVGFMGGLVVALALYWLNVLLGKFVKRLESKYASASDHEEGQEE